MSSHLQKYPKQKTGSVAQVVENLVCKTKAMNSKPYRTKKLKRRKMENMMIDNSICLLASWMQVLQNSLINYQ
jgi:hypothetical protein